MLTTTELVALVDREYSWFESRRRRVRKALAPSSGPLPNDEFYQLPVKDVLGGAWAEYDAEDALVLSTALQLEKCGMTFADGARFALNASVAKILLQTADSPDFYIGKLVDHDGAISHVSGDWPEVAAANIPSRAVSIVMNVSDVLRQLRVRARDLGFAEKLGW